MDFCIAILILKMDEKKQHFCHSMLYYFKKGKNASETQKIFAVYRKGAVTDWMCPKHFVKFLVSDFLFDDAPWLGRPVEHDSKKIETVLENNQQYTMWEIVNILKISTKQNKTKSKKSIESHFTILFTLITSWFGFHLS